jgi:small subunit ribosomal protein S5
MANGVIGWGLGKAGEVTAAIAKGVESAKKNLVKVPVLKGTVPHEMEAHFGGAQVLLETSCSWYWCSSWRRYACCS